MFVMQRIKIEDREKNNKNHPSLETTYRACQKIIMKYEFI